MRKLLVSTLFLWLLFLSIDANALSPKPPITFSTLEELKIEKARLIEEHTALRGKIMSGSTLNQEINQLIKSLDKESKSLVKKAREVKNTEVEILKSQIADSDNLPRILFELKPAIEEAQLAYFLELHNIVKNDLLYWTGTTSGYGTELIQERINEFNENKKIRTNLRAIRYQIYEIQGQIYEITATEKIKKLETTIQQLPYDKLDEILSRITSMEEKFSSNPKILWQLESLRFLIEKRYDVDYGSNDEENSIE